jgi:hypothetical protein
MGSPVAFDLDPSRKVDKQKLDSMNCHTNASCCFNHFSLPHHICNTKLINNDKS